MRGRCQPRFAPNAAGLKEASARLWKRSLLAAARARALAGVAPRALDLLRALQAAMGEAGDGGVEALIATGDVHYEVGAPSPSHGVRSRMVH